MDKSRSPFYRRGCRAHARPGLASLREWLLGAGARFGMEMTFQLGRPVWLGGNSLASGTRPAGAQRAPPAC